MTGSPAGIADWLQREVPGYEYPFRFIPFALATLLTCIWTVVVARSLRTTRRAVVNWSAGITMVWMLTMMLGLPVIDQARSYRGVVTRLAAEVGTSRCTIGVGVGDAQRALLDYFAGLRVVPPDHPRRRGATRPRAGHAGASPAFDAAGWREAWRGSRPGDRTEAFVLFRRGGRTGALTLAVEKARADHRLLDLHAHEDHASTARSTGRVRAPRAAAYGRSRLSHGT
ncbi:MAG: hypothetical protein MZW92_62440 [Comamonadaceae bacterium]|nr:hypothetical protein [Comamonadaceae bacterium]